MTKNKKKLWLAVCILLLFIICVGIFAGCNQGEKKYDVAIRIGCSDGSAYEFSVGTDELHIEIPYDVVERKYEVPAYNYPDHPTWSEHWISPNFESPNNMLI